MSLWVGTPVLLIIRQFLCYHFQKKKGVKINDIFLVSRLNHVAAGLVSPSLKTDTSSKEIEEAMKRVREAQSLISAAIEPGKLILTVFLILQKLLVVRMPMTSNSAGW